MMTVFAPSGDSIKINVTSSSQTVVLPAVPGVDGAIRLIKLTGVAGIIYYIKLGDSTITVSSNDGMVVRDSELGSSGLLVGVGAGETHIAILGSTSTIGVTSGSVVV